MLTDCLNRDDWGQASSVCFYSRWLGKLWILVTGSMESGADRQPGTEERWLLDRLIPKIHRIVVFLLTIQTMLLPILREIFSWFQSWTSSLLWTPYCNFLKLMFFRGMYTKRLRRTKEGPKVPKVQREIAMRSILSYLRSDLQKN